MNMYRCRPVFVCLVLPLLGIVLLALVDPVAAEAVATSHGGRILQEEMVPLALPGDRVALLRGDGDRVVVAALALPPGPPARHDVDVREGDVIVGFDDLAMPSLPQLRRVLAGVPAGERVLLRVLREGELLEFSYEHGGNTIMVPGRGAWNSSGASEGEGATADDGGDGPRPMMMMTAEPPEEEGAADAPELAAVLPSVAAGEPGIAIAVARGGGDVVSAARGLANVELGAALGADSMLPAASVTKAFTALIIARLVEDGRVSLDDDVREFLPELHEHATPIRIRDLLWHTSGLKDYTGLLSFTGWAHGDAVRADELLTLLSRQRELHFSPGERHQYSNTNYFLLAQIAARVTGTSFATALHEIAVAAAGLAHTRVPAPGEIVSGRAAGYEVEPGAGSIRRAGGNSEVGGAGGMLTTAEELAAWGQALLTGRLGTARTLELMQQQGRLADGSAIPYGMGLSTGDLGGHRRLGHSGSAPGASSVLHLYPDDGLVVAVMANRSDLNVFEVAESAAAAELGIGDTGAASRSGLPRGAMMITEEDIAGDDSEPPLPDEASRFAGRYRIENGDWVVDFENGRLLLRLRDDMPGVPLVLQPDGRYLFPPGRWHVTFHEEPDGSVDSLTVHIGEDSVRRGDPRDVPGMRIEVRELSDADREAYAGRYASDELGVVYRVIAAGGQLFLEHPRLGRLPLMHQVDDVFTAPGRTVTRVEFSRGDGGDVTGLRAEAYAWGATAVFTRLR